MFVPKLEPGQLVRSISCGLASVKALQLEGGSWPLSHEMRCRCLQVIVRKSGEEEAEFNAVWPRTGEKNQLMKATAREREQALRAEMRHSLGEMRHSLGILLDSPPNPVKHSS